MEDKIMEEKINELLKQNENNLNTTLEKRKELENVLSQLKENLNRNFENVTKELREMLQKIPYSREFFKETLKKDIYELYILSYRDKKEDNFFGIYKGDTCLLKGDTCLLKVYKYTEDIFINNVNDNNLNAKILVLQNIEEIKSMLLRLLYSVVRSNEESRKSEIEKLETEIKLLEGVVRKDAEGTEEKQWSDYISYVLVWCSENQQKTDNNILTFNEWQHQ